MVEQQSVDSLSSRISSLESDIALMKQSLSFPPTEANVKEAISSVEFENEEFDDFEVLEDEFPQFIEPIIEFSMLRDESLERTGHLDPEDRRPDPEERRRERRKTEKKKHPKAFMPFSRSLRDFSLREFDPVWYLSRYSDLKRAFGDDLFAAARHYLSHGVKELRSPNPGFDPKYYYDRYRDLRRYGRSGKFLLEHWYIHGIEEGRQGSPLFHPKYYLRHHSDLVRHFKDNHIAAFHHWKTHGHKERRQTAPGVILQLAWGDKPLSNGKFRTADGTRECIPEEGIIELGAREILNFKVCKKIPNLWLRQMCKKAIDKTIKFFEGDKPKVCDEHREIRVSRDPIFKGDIFVPDEIRATV